MKSKGIITINDGYFTTLKFVATLNAADLERTVGFERGRLKSGFRLVVLAGSETLAPDDFELAASTRYSGGIIKQAADGSGMGIEQILTEQGQDVASLKLKVSKFFSRRGDNTPTKVLPNLRHTDGMKYPDAEALGPGILSGVPQFKLLKPKKFVIVRAEK